MKPFQSVAQAVSRLDNPIDRARLWVNATLSPSYYDQRHTWYAHYRAAWEYYSCSRYKEAVDQIDNALSCSNIPDEYYDELISMRKEIFKWL